MTAIDPETEIVESSHDPHTRTHSYTIERGGKRWTISVPDDEFSQFGPIHGAQGKTNQMRRRAYLATKLSTAMQGPPDE